MPIEPGTRLGPYQILAPLGAGGMGEVYKALDTRLQREVAIKIAHERYAERFDREALAVASLSHPNIVAIFDVGTEGGMAYAVTELLEGETLGAMLRRELPAWQRAAEIAAAVCDGLSAAHAKGIIHRDLKPENIFTTTDRRVKILDFGLARIHRPLSETDATQTSDTQVMGTLGYISPEGLRGEVVGPASDLFSLGCVLYQMLCGRAPFRQGSSADVIAAILKEPSPPLQPSGRFVPSELARIVYRCLEKDASRRFASAADLASALRSVGTERELRTTIDSLAVLPFASSGGSDAEYLGDGIAERILNSFTRIPGLRVVPRSSVFRYKGSRKDPQVIGRELDARVLLTGRVVEHGGRLTVQVELVECGASRQLWGERFNRTMTDIFEVEEEIARQIADRLRVQFSGEQESRIVRRVTENSKAYQHYLRGQHQTARRTPDSLHLAIEHFEEAIAEDPIFALAYVGLTDAYNISEYYGMFAPHVALRREKAAAQRAVELAPDLAEAHAALGLARASAWDWKASEAAFLRALEIEPASWGVLDKYATALLCSVGRVDDAAAAIRRALESDPLSLVLHHHFAWILIRARRLEEAVSVCDDAIRLDPAYALAWLWRATACSQLSHHEEALAAAAKANSLIPAWTPGLTAQAAALARAGRREEAVHVLEDLRARAAATYVDPYLQAPPYVELGDHERAFELLQQAWRDHSIWLGTWLKGDPRLDPLQSDPRYQDLLRRIGVV